jgi:3-hydroxyacyl-[acyl-carrier-protein] dehydratase
MAPPLLYDLSRFDMDRLVYDVPQIEQINPHRGAMRLLDGVIHLDEETHGAIGFKDVRDDEFWVPGHIPGRPILPGVLMLEAGAQLASLVMKCCHDVPGFLGLVGFEDTKFRGQVVPGDRLILMGREEKFSPRRFTCAGQGVVNGTLVFETKILGMAI